jgi:hypothetical protein
MTYDPSNTYIKFKNNCNCGAQESGNSCTCSHVEDDCSCCPVGTVGVFNTEGDHVGCLTPNDAEEFVTSTHIPPTGYVKVIDGGGNYYGDLPPNQAIEMLDYIANGTIGQTAGDTFNVVTPDVGPTGFFELNYLASALISDVINLLIDRTGVDESITISIQNQPPGEPFAFNPSGTVTVMPSANSSLDVEFTWSGLVAGSYTFILRFASTNIVKEVPIRITLT